MNSYIPSEDIDSKGIFESMRSYGTRIFKLDEHIDRLLESARSCGIDFLAEGCLHKARCAEGAKRQNGFGFDNKEVPKLS